MAGKGELDPASQKPASGIVGIAVVTKAVHVANLQLGSQLKPVIPIGTGQKKMTVPASGEVCLLQTRSGIRIGEYALDELANLLSSTCIPGR